MHSQAFVFDRHGDLRSGWRVLLFIGLSVVLFLLLSIPLALVRAATDFLLKVVGTCVIAGATYIMTRFINHKAFSAIGLSLHPETVRQFGLGCLLGFLMITAVFTVEYLLGYVTLQWSGHTAFWYLWMLVSTVVIFLVGSVFEELLFRGYLFQTLMQSITFLPAMLVMMVLFAGAHARNPNVTVWGILNVALAGAWLSFSYLKTRSLWLPIGLHFSWNYSQSAVFSFPTSGIPSEGRSLAALVQSGPTWITGGEFGPEGGALTTLALLACTWYILKSKHFTAPEGIVTLDSPEDLLTDVPANSAGAS